MASPSTCSDHIQASFQPVGRSDHRRSARAAPRGQSLPWMASPSTCSDHIQASPPRMFASREDSEFALDGLPFHLFRPHTGFASKNVCLQRGLRVVEASVDLPRAVIVHSLPTFVGTAPIIAVSDTTRIAAVE